MLNNNPTNTVRGNSIHDNTFLGIDLSGDGVTPNDPLDADSGPNDLQNFPVITPQRGGNTTVVGGTLDSMPRGRSSTGHATMFNARNGVPPMA